MSEKYLDFKEICKTISFEEVLNWLNIPYSKRGDELKGNAGVFKFIVNIDKQLFFVPRNEAIKGSIINFLSEYNGMTLREAAIELQSVFNKDTEPPQRDIPELKLFYTPILEKFGITEEIAMQYEVGLVKQKSIMKGRIAFKVCNQFEKVEGYVGWHAEKDHWLFPKNFKRPVYNANNIQYRELVIVTVSTLECLRLISRGYSNCVALIAKSMSEHQESILKSYSKIILLHPEPENIILRLAPNSFIKAPLITKAIYDYSDEEIEGLLA